MVNMLTRDIAEYFVGKKAVVAVYLFGSHAEGKEQPMSDVDVGILLQDHAMPYSAKNRNRCMVELSRILRKDVHPVILNFAGEGLMKQIFSRGKCIVVNDPEKHTLFRTTMFSRIADFSAYKTQMQSGLAKKVMEMGDG
jgi:uncharacterized protein